MKISKKIRKAINYSALKHANQARKVDGLPYFVHPFSVALIISDYTNDEDTIAAAFLHDIPEDVKGYSFKRLENEFNKNIARIVYECSEKLIPNKTKKQSWKQRKETYLNKLTKASEEALLIATGDKIHNLNSVIDAYGVQGEKIWKKFNAGQNKKFWFYDEVLKVLKNRLKSDIVKHLERTIKKCKKITNLNAGKENSKDKQ